MTSHANHAATEAFFAEHRFFGLDRARVHFFRQGRMPAVDFNGRILLEAQGAIAMSPDGHGGSLRALGRSGALDLMQSEGVDTISYFQVDNPLVRCVDPAFIGWHRLRGAEMSRQDGAEGVSRGEAGALLPAARAAGGHRVQRPAAGGAAGDRPGDGPAALSGRQHRHPHSRSGVCAPPGGDRGGAGRRCRFTARTRRSRPWTPPGGR